MISLNISFSGTDSGLCIYHLFLYYYYYYNLIFSFTFVVFNPSLGLCQTPSDNMHFMYLYFLQSLLGDIFSVTFSQNDLLRRRAVLQSEFFYFSYWLGLPGILSRYLFIAFLVILTPSTVTGSMVVFKLLNVFNFYWQVFVFTSAQSAAPVKYTDRISAEG